MEFCKRQLLEDFTCAGRFLFGQLSFDSRLMILVFNPSFSAAATSAMRTLTPDNISEFTNELVDLHVCCTQHLFVFRPNSEQIRPQTQATALGEFRVLLNAAINYQT